MNEEFLIKTKKEFEIFNYDMKFGDIRRRLKRDYTNEQDMLFKILLNELIKNKNIKLYPKKTLEFNVFKELKFKNYSEDESKVFNDAYEIIVNLQKKLKENRRLRIQDDFLPLNKENKNKFLKGLLLGAFGTGKSVRANDFSDLDDSINIPVVGSSRSTIYPTSYIYVIDKYEDKFFKYIVQFKDSEELTFLIKEAVVRCISLVCKHDDKLNDKALVSEFLNDPENLFKIHFLLGKYYENPNNEKKERSTKYWISLIDEIRIIRKTIFEHIITKYNWNLEYNEENYQKIESYIDDALSNEKEKYNILIDDCISRVLNDIYSTAKIICSKIESISGEIIEINGEVLGFNGEYDRSNVNETVNFFIDNRPSKYGELLTPIVSYLRIEIPLSNELSDDIIERLEKSNKTLVLEDTVGSFHGSAIQGESVGGLINVNFDEYNFILLLDNAEKSMTKETEILLKEVKRCNIYEKIFIVYSHFNSFEKEELEDDDEKKEELLKIQSNKLKSFEKSDEILKFIEILKLNTVFLDRAKCSSCKQVEYEKMSKLLEQIMVRFNEINKVMRGKEKKDKKKLFVEYNFMRLGVVYQESRNAFSKQQYKIYFENKPFWSITKALTNRLSRRIPVYYGSTMTLCPLDNFQTFLGEQIDLFIRNPSLVNFEYNDNTEVESILNKLKENIINDIKSLIKEQFLENEYMEWLKIYNYFGRGSDLKRREKLLNQFKIIVPEMLNNEVYYKADFWLYEMKNIIEKNIIRLENLKFENDI